MYQKSKEEARSDKKEQTQKPVGHLSPHPAYLRQEAPQVPAVHKDASACGITLIKTYQILAKEKGFTCKITSCFPSK